ncbi:hypothetical protein OAT84_00555 [Gammaproteobacteria bacterium]|nr:hypothetical protein [Gammaproteobacteria bacterium]
MIKARRLRRRDAEYIYNHDYNSYIASFLAESFFWSLREQLKEHYTIEVIISEQQLSEQNVNLSIVYGHGGYWGDHAQDKKIRPKLLRQMKNRENMIFWGCRTKSLCKDDTSYVKECKCVKASELSKYKTIKRSWINSSPHKSVFVSDATVYPGGKILLDLYGSLWDVIFV